MTDDTDKKLPASWAAFDLWMIGLNNPQKLRLTSVWCGPPIQTCDARKWAIVEEEAKEAKAKSQFNFRWPA